jgi:hypothetical protein
VVLSGSVRRYFAAVLLGDDHVYPFMADFGVEVGTVFDLADHRSSLSVQPTQPPLSMWISGSLPSGTMEVFPQRR